ncbi:MAG: flagellar hook-basal body complex protein FliE [Pseudomonadota bacterium]
MSPETTLATLLYGTPATRAATNPTPAGGGMSFSEALNAAASRMGTTLEQADRSMAAASTGSADIQEVVEALTAAEMAIETAVVMRDRVVEAYQEILRMPV